MSFLSSITSDIKSLATDPGKIAKEVCDAVLPSNMKAVGDILGGAIDLETGHPLQALSHMADTLKDLPQMAQGLPGSTTAAAKAASTPAGTAAAEPTPPPPRPPSLQQVISELTTLANGGATTAAKLATTATGGSPAGAPPAAPASTPAATSAATAPASTAPPPATGMPAGESVSVSYRAPTVPRTSLPPNNSPQDQVSVSVNVGGTTVTVTENMAAPRRSGAPTSTGWRSTPALTVNTTPTSSAAGSTTGAATGAVATAPAAATSVGTSAATSGTSSAPAAATTGSATAIGTTAGTSSSAGAASATGATGSAATTTPSSLSSLMSMSNDQFMQAVTSGNIPADVANNPSAMAEIQARMNQITQMNQLVTSMMAAMHQMQMAIIQNIRV